MLDYIRQLLDAPGYAPHGFCLLWNPALIWTHVTADALIGISYFSIPIAIAYFLTQRRDVQFSWVVWMFALFITSCGLTHFASIWTLWHPDYGMEALVKVVTAGSSVVTAIALWPLLPQAVRVPSPAQLQLANGALIERIAERDAALNALERETAERARTEDMLRQAQKMEAVGQLTGGVAHDFNNLLTIVLANLDRARRFAGDGTDPRAARALASAAEGAERAALLTSQLLAFSRQQPLQPSLHDANALVRTTLALAERALPDRVQVHANLAAHLPPVLVDGPQTETALLNLIVNARDAMPDGGILGVKTSAIHATEDDLTRTSVMIEISDTGIGMDAATQARAFEPFFTTKPVGQGTGLGLSQVYGFVQQTGGSVAVESAPGHGTAVRIVLPTATPV